MKVIIILTILTFLPILTFSQDQLDQEIMKTILQKDFQNGSDYVQCSKAKTYFDVTDFDVQNGDTILVMVLNELQNASRKSEESTWGASMFNDKEINSLIKGSGCLSRQDVEKLFKTTGERQRIISVSDPLFDVEQEHCVVSVTYTYFIGSASGQSYLLKKVYGNWTIISIFGIWIT